MRLAEIRDLDGPNLFLLQPAIKVEFVLDAPDELLVATERLERLAEDGERPADSDALLRFESAASNAVHRFNPGVATMARWMETPNHVAFAFEWNHRRAALAIADLLVRCIEGEPIDLDAESAAIATVAETIEEDDRPELVRDGDRRVPIVGITGTNGKTTTTRLLAHILMETGRHVGWSSSSGVYIDGEEVLAGDYSGPSGARRVLSDPRVDVAVLETARGGILLRGVAYESNEVGVFTNISADHLDLQGVRTVNGLAEVKSVVVRVTKADGTVVLNADDPLVMHASRDVRASKLFFSRDPASEEIAGHVASGGRAVVHAGEELVFLRGAERTVIAALGDMPITFGGRAVHMIENAMAATGAALGLGLDIDQIRHGLTSFKNSTEQNLGRLNVFDLDGITVVLDYAHNEAGLANLIAFTRSYLGENGGLALVVGTAGDRNDESLRELARLAAANADTVVIKASQRYLRGRPYDDLISLYQQGIAAAGKPPVPVAPSELEGLQLALSTLAPGDAVAVMAQEQLVEITEFLRRAGANGR